MSYRRNVICSRRAAMIIVAVSALSAFAARLVAGPLAWPPVNAPAQAPAQATVRATAQAGSDSSASGSSGPRSYRRTSDWWLQVELIDGSLRNGKWKYARKNAKNLGKRVLREAWNDRELAAILAELALYQAIAEANLDRRDDAIWHWHTALNLVAGIANRDFSDYGDAGRLFVEFPLRTRGEMPPGFQNPAPDNPGLVTMPRPPNAEMPTLLNNTGANKQGSGDFEVDLVVDDRGDLHQPVVISRHLHPIVIYATLEWLHGMPAFGPALFQDRPVSAVSPLVVGFQISPYGPHMTIKPPPTGS